MQIATFFHNLNTKMQASLANLQSSKAICGSALLCACNILLTSIRIDISPLLTISFASLAIALCSYYYGPLMSGIACVIADTLSFIIRPNGPYFPGFAINAFLIAFIYGCFFYQQQVISIKRVITARICIVIIINLFLTPLWLSLMYGEALLASARIIKNIILFPLDAWLLYLILSTGKRLNFLRVN